MTPAPANHVFRALADPTRRAFFEQLTRQGEQTVHALTRYAGVSQPAVSKHLTVLKRAKLVRHRREGRETHYRAQPDALAPMIDWLNLYGASGATDSINSKIYCKGWTNDRYAPTLTLLIDREMPHPPEKVWRALTQRPLIEEWLMTNDFQPIVGHRFTFRATPMPN